MHETVFLCFTLEKVAMCEVFLMQKNGQREKIHLSIAREDLLILHIIRVKNFHKVIGEEKSGLYYRQI